MDNQVKNALEASIIALEKEVRKEPVSPDRVAALSDAIQILSGINPRALR